MSFSDKIIKACLTNSENRQIKQHIKTIGLEYEAWFYDYMARYFDIKEDGSVKFYDSDGNRIPSFENEDCECHLDCSCAECRICRHCEFNTINCDCDECRVYSCCGNSFDNGCDCEIEKQDDCPNKKTCLVGNNEPCDYCIDCHYDSREYEINCDSRISCCLDCDCSCECTVNQIGEIATKPLTLDQIESVNSDIYEGIQKVNQSTGFHLHLGMNEEYIHVLCTQKFYQYFLTQIKQWGIKNKINSGSRFWQRLDGAEYAQRKFIERQISDCGDADRYTHLNFCAWFRHRTLEVRLAPQFNQKEIALSYVYEVYRIVNEYLDNNKPKTFKYTFRNSRNDITLKVKQENQGLKVFAKSKTVGEFNTNFNVLRENDHYTNNTKQRFFEDILFQNDRISIEDHYSCNRLNVYDTRSNSLEPNMKFILLNGLEYGNSFYLEGVYTENQINEYFENMQGIFNYITRNYIEENYQDNSVEVD